MPAQANGNSKITLGRGTNIEDLIDHMTESKISQTKDDSMETLAAAMRVKWMPTSTDERHANAKPEKPEKPDRQHEGHGGN